MIISLSETIKIVKTMIIEEVKKKYEKESLTKATKTANKTDRAQKS